MEYKFRAIEKKWQQHWAENNVYAVSNNSTKPKYYVLDMFPYPSGAGLHVGHPLGYIASDIFSRYKRLKGFNVLHPMGYDAFGLPAEQYAIEHGVHPAVSTDQNINNFRQQLDNIGFCYDWDREVRTCNPSYYKWTQWIFLQLFHSFYNRSTNKAEPIANLIRAFELEGNMQHAIPNSQHPITSFTAEEWKAFDEKTQQDILMQYRLAYCGYGEVNWCEALGTVLANDEVVNGVSERGGHPVVKKKLRQWYLRITEYADRLQSDLQKLDWSDAMKDMQTNWIGKSSGAEISFQIKKTNLNGLTSPQPLSKGEGQASQPGYFTSTVEQWKFLSDFAKQNRKNATEAEDALWQAIRNRKIKDCKFRRQHPIAGFIPDFVCLEQKLIIEIDGNYHNKEEQQQYDTARTSWLQEYGYKLIRFTNDEVLNEMPKVLQQLGEALSSGEGLGEVLTVYTTRPDTIFGVDFMVIAPEHELVENITTPEQQQAVTDYITYVKSRSERERMAEKKISGVFTGAYAINPFDGRAIPIWISEYVLAGYGTGAIMAVPCGDERDFKFAQHFNIPITNIIGEHFNGTEANPTKEAILQNSGFLTGLKMKDAIEVAINKLEDFEIGTRKTNYKMRDAAFSRQRYWGEPFPIVWKNGIAVALDETALPLTLPDVESYSPGPEGEGPLANIDSWKNQYYETHDGVLETNTMPGYAGSSWYFLRYMDPHNDTAFVDKKVSDYWNSVDLYIGGTEHAVGHLLYSRMWTKALYDLGHIGFDEPFKKLLNQGMITGISEFLYKMKPSDGDDEVTVNSHFVDIIKDSEIKRYYIDGLDIYNTAPIYFSSDIAVEFNKFKQKELSNTAFERYSLATRINIEYVNKSNVVNYSALVEKYPHYFNCVFATKTGYYFKGNFHFYEDSNPVISDIITTSQSEKMSKSKLNTQNPDDLCEQYGADTFRMYEMFLGPVEQSKPWDTKGIEGVHRFLKKLWRLFFDEEKGGVWNTIEPTAAELKILHRTIKKIEDDTERFSFNTAVSAFMVCVNELSDVKCHKKAILEQLLILLTPYAPHIAEELWQALGNEGSIIDAPFPVYNEAFTKESAKDYPVSFNGKMRTTISFPADAEQQDIEPELLANETVQKWLEGKTPKKIIFVKGRMINIVF
jgi:leucyl-tRNA synthetase